MIETTLKVLSVLLFQLGNILENALRGHSIWIFKKMFQLNGMSEVRFEYY